MGIRQKFFVLAGVAGLIMAIVSGVGYYTAYSNLANSVEKEILATVEVEGQSLNGWLREKAEPAVAAARRERAGTVTSRAARACSRSAGALAAAVTGCR